MKQEEIKDEMKKNNDLMSGKGEGGKWITVNGSHIFIEDGQSVDEAMEKHFSKSGDTKTNDLVKKYQSAVDHAIKTYGRVGVVCMKNWTTMDFTLTKTATILL